MVFACFFLFPTFSTMNIFHFWQGVGGRGDVTGFFSPIFYRCLCALTNPAFCNDHSLSLEAPSHLHLQIIPKVFFSKESQSLSDWLLCRARVCMSLSAQTLPITMADTSLFLTTDYRILEGRDSSSPLFFQLPACPGCATNKQ